MVTPEEIERIELDYACIMAIALAAVKCQTTENAKMFEEQIRKIVTAVDEGRSNPLFAKRQIEIIIEKVES